MLQLINSTFFYNSVKQGNTKTEGHERSKLLNEWASVLKWIKFQPIDEIKDYLGVNFAFYFVWLGFYTYMLIPATIVGILCILYGIITLPQDRLSQDICNESLNYTMCPNCNTCGFRKLSDTCTFSKINYIIDNPSIIFFATFMSLWSALYLELWKRYSAEITHRWGLTGYDLKAEPPRNEYIRKTKNAKLELEPTLNTVTQQKEFSPLEKTKTWKIKQNTVTQKQEIAPRLRSLKVPSIILSFSVVLMMVSKYCYLLTY